MILKQSDSDADHRQESMVASLGPSRDTEGFTEVLKDVKALEPVIAMLIDKVALDGNHAFTADKTLTYL